MAALQKFIDAHVPAEPAHAGPPAKKARGAGDGDTAMQEDEAKADGTPVSSSPGAEPASSADPGAPPAAADKASDDDAKVAAVRAAVLKASDQRTADIKAGKEAAATSGL